MNTDAQGLAPSERVAEQIRQDIRKGRLKPGDKLSTHRDMVTKYEIAVTTVQKVLKQLEAEGWVVARPSIGVFVSDSIPAVGEPLTLAAVAQQVAELSKTVADLQRKIDGA